MRGIADGANKELDKGENFVDLPQLLYLRKLCMLPRTPRARILVSVFTLPAKPDL
jgi:hypothetical protein